MSRCFKHSKEEVNQMKNGFMFGYLKRKCAGYRVQDNRANRIFDETKYVEPNWIMNQLYKQKLHCPHCNEMYIINDESTNFVCNRLDNNKPHHIDNLEVCCINCNCSLAKNARKN